MQFLPDVLLRIIPGIIEFPRFANSSFGLKRAVLGGDQIIFDLLRFHSSLELVQLACLVFQASQQVYVRHFVAESGRMAKIFADLNLMLEKI